MPSSSDAVVKLVTSISAVDAAQWDACANPAGAIFNPFIAHAFLKALEDSRSVGSGTGWLPRHLVIEDERGNVSAAAPAYFKSHSQGEYVFDHGWAEAYEQAGGRYYPKLQIAVPFTPVPGPRLLVKPGPRAYADEQLLAAAAIEVARQGGLSSVHLTFLSPDTAERLRALGFLTRTGQQFHWQNHGYGSFDDFLATLASRKRKAIRKEREAAVAPGIEIHCLTGRKITEAHWDAMFAFYLDTGSRKWGRPYLNRAFFSLLGQSMADSIVLMLAYDGATPIAGAINFVGKDRIYGRNWGCTRDVPFLHFELCYYQAIDYAIAHQLAVVEAGAQGEHKLARGYAPAPTHSVHWIAHPGLRQAVADYLDREKHAVAHNQDVLEQFTPFRKGARTDQ
jgi:predicted N-acyltransferase